MKELVIGAMAVIAAMAIIFGTALWFSFVGQYLWLWFIVPLGAPAINIWHMWGLFTFKGILLSGHALQDYKDKTLEAVGTLTFAPLIALIVGYLIHGWI